MQPTSLHRLKIAAAVFLAVILGAAATVTYRIVSDRHLKPSQQTVVLVHGLLNKPFVMNGIAKVLRDAGYSVTDIAGLRADKAI